MLPPDIHQEGTMDLREGSETSLSGHASPFLEMRYTGCEGEFGVRALTHQPPSASVTLDIFFLFSFLGYADKAS